MHQSSYDKVLDFKSKYLANKVAIPQVIYDVGSQDVNGTYRPIFSEERWKYIGVDMAQGSNVDIVLSDPHKWQEIASKTADVIVSGQAFEHMTNIWAVILEVTRILKPGGLCCIVVPSSGFEHRYPVDCWRFYPDGLVALASFGNLEVIEVYTQWEDGGYTDGSDTWHDSVLICRRPILTPWQTFKRTIKHRIQHKALTLGKRAI
jgi:SAM-dependent methyltransferase